jgi:hypothetical protein
MAFPLITDDSDGAAFSVYNFRFWKMKTRIRPVATRDPLGLLLDLHSALGYLSILHYLEGVCVLIHFDILADYTNTNTKALDPTARDCHGDRFKATYRVFP